MPVPRSHAARVEREGAAQAALAGPGEARELVGNRGWSRRSREALVGSASAECELMDACIRPSTSVDSHRRSRPFAWTLCSRRGRRLNMDEDDEHRRRERGGPQGNGRSHTTRTRVSITTPRRTPNGSSVATPSEPDHLESSDEPAHDPVRGERCRQELAAASRRRSPVTGTGRADIDQRGSARFVPVIFSDWQDEPSQQLVTRIESEAARFRAPGRYTGATVGKPRGGRGDARR